VRVNLGCGHGSAHNIFRLDSDQKLMNSNQKQIGDHKIHENQWMDWKNLWNLVRVRWHLVYIVQSMHKQFLECVSSRGHTIKLWKLNFIKI
jgi:hypothetical protein